MKTGILVLATAALAVQAGCFGSSLKMLNGQGSPLETSVLQGTDRKHQVLLLPVQGSLTTDPRSGFLADQPSVVQEVVAQLRKAEKDDRVKAVVLWIDSPGGSATATDVLYREVEGFKKRTGKPVVAHFVNKGASGAYYVALAADRILAHPTSLVGSIGVLFVRPKAKGLMDKIGLDVEVAKSGDFKDMGAWYRPGTDAEKGLYQKMVKELADAFIARVLERRKLASSEAFADARIMSAGDAKAAGLVDGLGYLDDALAAARELAGLPADARVIAYRRDEVADDNAWAGHESGGKMPKLLDLGVTRYLSIPSAGFYYLWAPELGD